MRTHRQLVLEDLDGIEEALKQARIACGAVDDGPVDLWMAIVQLEDIKERADRAAARCGAVSAIAFETVAREQGL